MGQGVSGGLYIIAGTNAVGKTTLCFRLLEELGPGRILEEGGRILGYYLSHNVFLLGPYERKDNERRVYGTDVIGLDLKETLKLAEGLARQGRKVVGEGFILGALSRKLFLELDRSVGLTYIWLDTPFSVIHSRIAVTDNTVDKWKNICSIFYWLQSRGVRTAKLPWEDPLPALLRELGIRS